MKNLFLKIILQLFIIFLISFNMANIRDAKFSLKELLSEAKKAKERIEKWPKWQREVVGYNDIVYEDIKKKYERNLLKACQDLHMNNTHSYLDMLPKEKSYIISFLKEKIVNWNYDNCSNYDFVVFKLIETVLKECDGK